MKIEQLIHILHAAKQKGTTDVIGKLKLSRVIENAGDDIVLKHATIKVEK